MSYNLFKPLLVLQGSLPPPARKKEDPEASISSPTATKPVTPIISEVTWHESPAMFQVIMFQVHQFAQAVKDEVIGRFPELTPSMPGTISTCVVENMPRFAHHLTLLNMLFLSGDLIFANI